MDLLKQFLLVLPLSTASWATTASCVTTMALSNIGLGTGNGCYTVDQTYSNFGVGNAGGSPVQSSSTVDITGSSTWASDASPWVNTVIFSGNTGANSNTPAPWTAATGQVAGSIFFDTNSTQAYFPVSGYPTGGPLLIDSVGLSATASYIGTPGTIYAFVFEFFCVGAGNCSTGATGNEITLEEQFESGFPALYSCSYASTSANAGATCSTVGASSSPITVTLNTPEPTLFVTNNFVVRATGGVTSATLTNFSDIFGNEEVPEPSTFALLGAGLGAAAWLRRRK